MITKNQKKLIRSLKQKKYRRQYKLFVVEGIKVINELLNSNFELESLFVLESAKNEFDIKFQSKIIQISPNDLDQISFLTTSQKALALFKIPQVQNSIKNTGLMLALDNIQDPGNLGTIIRLADWFGVQTMLCSSSTVDCFNPKVVQATMGSLTRVNIIYCDLKNALKNTTLPIYGTFLKGKSIYDLQLPKDGIIVLGNEANGISREIEKTVSKKITIPQFGQELSTESLNVSTAAAIVLNEFMRNTI